MYAQLGDIVFERLKGFDRYSDTQETMYAEHALIKNKPKLQAIGEKLIEISISGRFHAAFCTPEEEFDKFVQHRKNSEILPFIWGTGEVVGEFVIASIKRNVDTLGPDGGIWDHSFELSLKEVVGLNSANEDKKRAVKNSFATTEDAPLPTSEVNEPATDAVAATNDVGAVSLKTNDAMAKMNNAVNQSNAYTLIIDQAQAFVDALSTNSSVIFKNINLVSKLLNDLTSKMTANPKLGQIAPFLAAQVSSSAAVVVSAQTLVSQYASMPNPVTNFSQATNVIGIMGNTSTMITNLSDTLKDLRDKSQPLMAAVASRQII